jgi:hypothetical protein
LNSPKSYYNNINNLNKNPSKLLNNKRVKIDLKEIISENTINENKHETENKIMNIPKIKPMNFRLPNINKSIALRKFKENKDINQNINIDKNIFKDIDIDKYLEKKEKGILKENLNTQPNEKLIKSNSQVKFIKINYTDEENNYHTDDNFIINNNNLKEIENKNKNKKFISKFSNSPKIKSINLNIEDKENLQEKIDKIHNDTLNSDFDKEKENNENINEISNMMKHILNIL